MLTKKLKLSTLVWLGIHLTGKHWIGNAVSRKVATLAKAAAALAWMPELVANRRCAFACLSESLWHGARRGCQDRAGYKRRDRPKPRNNFFAVDGSGRATGKPAAAREPKTVLFRRHEEPARSDRDTTPVCQVRRNPARNLDPVPDLDEGAVLHEWCRGG